MNPFIWENHWEEIHGDIFLIPDDKAKVKQWTKDTRNDPIKILNGWYLLLFNWQELDSSLKMTRIF